MGQMSTAGFAGLVAGEDWHYVGEAGEPAWYDPGSGDAWTNGNPSAFNLAYRIREAGVVDIQGTIQATSTPPTSDIVFRLPEGYRPSNIFYGACVGQVATSFNYVPLVFSISTTGFVSFSGGNDNPYKGAATSLLIAYINIQAFLEPPTTP